MSELIRRGQLATKNNNLIEAIESFTKAVSDNSKDPQARVYLGQALCWQGQREKGLQHLYEAAELVLKKCRKSRDVNPLLDVAGQLQNLDDYTGALALCKKAVKINVRAVRGHQFLALTYLRLNQKKNALVSARQALKLVPNNSVLAILLATIEIANGLFEPAKKRLEKVLQDPLIKPEEKFRAHKELARVLDKLAAYDQVFPHVRAAAKVSEFLADVKRQDEKRIPEMLETYKVEFNTDLLKRWSGRDFPEEQSPPVFVLGFMRTGTTLTQEVLGAHPNAVIADEIDLIDAVGNELSRMFGHQGNRVEQLNQLDWDGVLSLRKFYWNRAKTLLGDKLDGKLLIDKTTMNSLDLGIINTLFPDAKLIFLLRDPRDVCLSCIMQTMAPTASTVHLLSWQKTAAFYALVMEWWEIIKPKLSMPYIEMRYEDAVFHFEKTFADVFEFLALDWEQSVVDFHKSAAKKYIASPSFDQVSQPLYSSSVGRWQHYKEEYELISETLQPYIDAYDYR